MDFFTVPTLTFGALYCSFIIAHDRRRILHFNVTRHPTSSWTVQQLRQAFPYDSAPRFLLFDHDAKYGLEVPASIRSLKMTPVRTAIQSPWQNGVAERWVGSCRRDLLDPGANVSYVDRPDNSTMEMPQTSANRTQTLNRESEQVPSEVIDLIGGGGRTRTYDLRIMSWRVYRRLQSSQSVAAESGLLIREPYANSARIGQ
jgi:transposase InsO family protein